MNGDNKKPIIQALQRLCQDLEARQSPSISTQKLTESFDWDKESTSTHHDPQGKNLIGSASEVVIKLRN